MCRDRETSGKGRIQVRMPWTGPSSSLSAPVTFFLVTAPCLALQWWVCGIVQVANRSSCAFQKEGVKKEPSLPRSPIFSAVPWFWLDDQSSTLDHCLDLGDGRSLLAFVASCSVPGWEWRGRQFLIWEKRSQLTTLSSDYIWREQRGSELRVVRFHQVSLLEIGSEAAPPRASCVLSPLLELWIWFLVLL